MIRDRRRPTTRVAALVLVIGWPCLVQAPARAEEPSVIPEPGVAITHPEGGEIVDVILPGRLVGYALGRRSGVLRDVLLLAEEVPRESSGPPRGGHDPDVHDHEEEMPADPPCEGGIPGSPERQRLLVRLDTTGAGSLQVIREHLPVDIEGLETADIDADGNDEILLLSSGAITTIRPTKTAEGSEGPDPRWADPRIDADGIDPAVVRYPGLADIGYRPFSFPGGVHIYGPGPEEAPWDLRAAVEIPLEAVIDEGALRLSGPRLHPVVGGGASRLLAAGPRGHAGRRLLTVLIDPFAPGDERAREVWSRLPEPEYVIDSAYTMLDDRPVLVVLTRSAEKLSFTAEKRLRVFPLDGRDRSQAGQAPLVAMESNANLWQSASIVVRDLDDDGLDDLVLGYWKGLKDNTLVLDAYTREGDGGFRTSPATTRFDHEVADRGVLGYGHDLDGDGRPELILESGDRMMIHAGREPGRRGKDLVEETPRWSFPTDGLVWQPATPLEMSLGEGREVITWSDGGIGAVRVVDLGADGRTEILSLRAALEGRGRFRITRLTR